MAGNAGASERIIGSLRLEDGEGIARMEDRFDASIDDVWSALTEPRRLARWYGEVAGDLGVGGEFHVRHADGERNGRVDACEAPNRLLVTLRDPDARPGQPEKIVNEVWLSADGGQTLVVAETRGLPPHLLAAYGVGVQIHVEHLADYASGRESGDTEARWEELFPSYEALAANIG
jgi:uncharacterized protein YndB with AHSA1/START domain